MRKRQKKILGFFGLSAIVVLTAVAVAIPDPNVSAANSSVVDHINVRVVSGTPDVNISGLTNNGYYTEPKDSITVDYAHINSLVIDLTYTDLDGNVIHESLADMIITDDSGVITINVPDHGYGNYVIYTKGVGPSGVFDEETVVFYCIPLIADVVEDETSNEYYADLDYIADDGTEETRGNVKYVDVDVYNDHDELVKHFRVPAPVYRLNLEMDEDDLPSGDYTLVVTSYDADGEVIYEPFEKVFHYEALDIDVADTGVFFGQLEIAKNDYLITSLIIFMLVAIAGIIIIAKTGNTKAKANATRSNKVSKASRASKATKVNRMKKVSAKNARAKKTTKTVKPRKR